MDDLTEDEYDAIRALDTRTEEDQALEAIWEHFESGDWGNALRVITAYGIDQKRDGHQEVVSVVKAKVLLDGDEALERLLVSLQDRYAAEEA